MNTIKTCAYVSVNQDMPDGPMLDIGILKECYDIPPASLRYNTFQICLAWKHDHEKVTFAITREELKQLSKNILRMLD